MYDEINTLSELVRAVQNEKTGGYDVEFDILPNKDFSRTDEGSFWLVIEVRSNRPINYGTDIDPPLSGQWWFYTDNTVMQVL